MLEPINRDVSELRDAGLLKWKTQAEFSYLFNLVDTIRISKCTKEKKR